MDISKLINILINRTSAHLIILFGSAAAERMRQDSDIDLAFLSEKELNAFDVYNISQELAEVLGKEVDLIDLSKASTVFKANILGTGKIVYSSDQNKKHAFQINTFKEYALLNERRNVVLDKIRERGSVYEQ
jgi:predicted nucleotidyltransferase